MQAHESSPEFQSTPPVKAATVNHYAKQGYSEISIHAAREGGDAGRTTKKSRACDFNPRRP